ncbi:alginate export family protein [Haloferula sp. BvORR071]|uniref:alginate export family protein n=1 Tax=Haloferula sp. BvORR071 TaxID=1396141 RepID=UPI000A5D5471|nr:alginate export family protein [Haloferula sp. BvORR071]
MTKSAPLLICLSLIAGAEAQEDWQFSIKGQARTMYESYHGLDFGFDPIKDDDWIHQRVQIMTTADYGESLRFAAEFTWGKMAGKESPLAPPDEDDPDLLQCFIQGRLPLDESTLEARVGRQTLYYGSGRLLAAREGANQRLSHDAVLLSWQRGENSRVDAFIASPVRVEPDAFDNSSDPGELLLWSVYAVTPLPWGRDNFADIYYIGLRDEDSIFAPGGHETRHTLGARFWRTEGPWLHNTELIAQFGDAGGRDILAGAASLGVGRELSTLPWKPVPQLRADVISGGDKGGTIHSFHPLFQANNYFNEGGFLSPSNLYNLNPLLGLHPCEQVEISLGVNFQWLFSTHDSIYGPPLQRLATPRPDGNRYLGTAFNASVAWNPRKDLEYFLGYTHHEAGAAIEDICGSSVDYVQASFRLSF